MLPEKNGAIDWDAVADDYHRCILGPYAPEMVARGADGACRNPLLEYLYRLPAGRLAALRIADFGCGPGNLIAHLPRGVERLVCVDQSRGALKRAEMQGERFGVAVEPVESDIAALDGAHQYELIVSVNAILPDSRAAILRQLRAIGRCLAPGGRLLAILPSFDTTEYLRDLWRRHYEAGGLDEAAIAAAVTAFEQSRQMDPDNLAYADDGRNAQCYHTPASIKAEFAAAGLAPLHPPEKVYYPWELTRRFGYGYFPDAGEEIWDWFVVAGRSR